MHGTSSFEVLRACLQLPLEAEPGARAEYSDPGFILLGKALEVIIGESLPSWAQREIFHPLGMTSTRFSPPPAARAGIPPTEEDRSFRHRRIQGEVQDENAWLLQGAAGHAGLFSNMPNLLCFAGEILNSQMENGQRAKQTFLNPPLSNCLPRGKVRRVVRVHSAGIRPQRTRRRDATFPLIP